MRRGIVPVTIALLSSVVTPAAAHPVRVGRYAEIAYGIRADHPYATARGGPRRTGRLRGTAPHQEPMRMWERTLRHRRPRGPSIAADGTLYIGTIAGLTSLTPDGNERWSVRLGPVDAAPSLAPAGDVVALTRGGLVVRVSSEGLVRASANLGAPARGAALVLQDGSVLAITTDRRLHRLDPDLRSVYALELDDGGRSSGGRLVTGISLTTRGRLAVPSGTVLSFIDPAGRIERHVDLGGRASSPAAIADDGTLWVATVEGDVLAIDPSGRIRSRAEVGSRHYDGAAPVVGHDGALRLPTLGEGLVCIGPGGTERWRVPNPAGYNAPATIDDEDTTLIVDRGGRMFAIAADGTERWRVVLGTFTFQPAVLGPNGTIYVTTERGAVQAWRAR